MRFVFRRLFEYFLWYETEIAYCRYAYYEFDKDGVKYNVYVYYDGIQKTEGQKIPDEIYMIEVVAKDNEKTWWCQILGNAVNDNPDYLASFQLRLIDTRE